MENYRAACFNSNNLVLYFVLHRSWVGRHCGRVVRVPGYRSRGPGLSSWNYHIYWEVLGLEQDPLSLVRIIEELLEWKNSGSDPKQTRLTAVRTRCTDHMTSLCLPLDIISSQILAVSTGFLCLPIISPGKCQDSTFIRLLPSSASLIPLFGPVQPDYW
jgi:hypothetical protein